MWWTQHEAAQRAKVSWKLISMMDGDDVRGRRGRVRKRWQTTRRRKRLDQANSRDAEAEWSHTYVRRRRRRKKTEVQTTEQECFCVLICVLLISFPCTGPVVQKVLFFEYFLFNVAAFLSLYHVWTLLTYFPTTVWRVSNFFPEAVTVHCFLCFDAACNACSVVFSFWRLCVCVSVCVCVCDVKTVFDCENS